MMQCLLMHYGHKSEVSVVTDISSKSSAFVHSL